MMFKARFSTLILGVLLLHFGALVNAASQKTVRITGLAPSVAQLECHADPNLAIETKEKFNHDQLKGRCQKYQADCATPAASLFAPFAFPVDGITRAALNVKLQEEGACWVSRNTVRAVGLRVSTLDAEGAKVACDPHGGMGASACAKE